jgi:tRNA pseudouridine55 synthase
MLGNAGFLLVNKPEGISSFKIVKKVRYFSEIKKVGHAGTLDPFASGLMVLALTRNFTRKIDEIQSLYKVYDVEMVLGVETDTLDSYGKIVNTDPSVVGKIYSENEINDVFCKFIGTQLQESPIYSAKKIDGKRSCDLVRKGKIIEAKVSTINIFEINLVSINKYGYPVIRFRVKSSKGTYVRSLVRDVAKELGTVAYTKNLVRTQIGSYSLENALEYNDLTKEAIQKALFTS